MASRTFAPRLLAISAARATLPVGSALPTARQLPQQAKALVLPTSTLLFQRRWHSAPANRPKVYQFEEIKNLSQNPSEDRILIDVREPSEYTAGYIPTALNVPVKTQPDAWFLPPEEFEDRFGFPKPDPAKEVVFYCKAGVRSSAAASLAEKGGYEKVGEYLGSWLDWERNGGEKST